MILRVSDNEGPHPCLFKAGYRGYMKFRVWGLGFPWCQILDPKTSMVVFEKRGFLIWTPEK